MDKKGSHKKFSEDAAKALESCINAFSLAEFSRVTGVRIELLRRFINRRARNARVETWDKIYPTLKPLLLGPEPKNSPPPRIGSPYRRHLELVDMLSDQKVLLDVFDILNDSQRKAAAAALRAAGAADAAPTTFKSLSEEENLLMGLFLALPPEERKTQLLALVKTGTETLRRRRREMF
ncbi:MAG: hypothetical protein IJS01_07285 [Lentisphaeria bacterium]|nr:hypothetical protein [Lentisphaeria bacterium]